MKVLMHALAASCEELCARTGNPPLLRNGEISAIIESYSNPASDCLHGGAG